METVMFYLLAVTILGAAFFVVALRRPIHNVLFMILTMIGLAGMFVMLKAEFLAMVQLIVRRGCYGLVSVRHNAPEPGTPRHTGR